MAGYFLLPVGAVSLHGGFPRFDLASPVKTPLTLIVPLPKTTGPVIETPTRLDAFLVGGARLHFEVELPK
jgi:hypothetical protein